MKKPQNVKQQVKLEKLSPVAAALARAVNDAMKQMPEGASKENLRVKLAQLTNGKIGMRPFVERDFPIVSLGIDVYRKTESSPIAVCSTPEMARAIALRLNRDNQVHPEEE